MLSNQQYSSATSTGKNNPLLEMDSHDTGKKWQTKDYLSKPITEVTRSPSDSGEHRMRSIATTLNDVEFWKAEQVVTYPDGKVRKENVCWDGALQIYYWQSCSDGKWYFEDPLKNDAVIYVGSHQNLMKKLEQRQFWWLEVDEDITVIRNPDGSKSYEYKGVHDPVEITILLDQEAKQAQLEAEKPVAKWKAIALSAMSLLGNSMGFQSLAKSYVPVIKPKQPEPSRATTTYTQQLFTVAPSIEEQIEQPIESEGANFFEQYSFVDNSYQPQLAASALQLTSIVATGAALILRPRFDRERGTLNFLNLLALLMHTKPVNGHGLAPEPIEATSNAETFTDVFPVETLSDDSYQLTMPRLAMDVNFEQEAKVPDLKPTMAVPKPLVASMHDLTAVVSHQSGEISPAVVNIPVVDFEKPCTPSQARLTQKMVDQVEKKPLQLPIPDSVPTLSVANEQHSQAVVPIAQLKPNDDASKVSANLLNASLAVNEKAPIDGIDLTTIAIVVGVIGGVAGLSLLAWMMLKKDASGATSYGPVRNSDTASRSRLNTTEAAAGPNQQGRPKRNTKPPGQDQRQKRQALQDMSEMINRWLKPRQAARINYVVSPEHPKYEEIEGLRNLISDIVSKISSKLGDNQSTTGAAYSSGDNKLIFYSQETQIVSEIFRLSEDKDEWAELLSQYSFIPNSVKVEVLATVTLDLESGSMPGLHAEVALIRYICQQLEIDNGKKYMVVDQQCISELANKYSFAASQPPCWDCAGYLATKGIFHLQPGQQSSNKWIHPTMGIRDSKARDLGSEGQVVGLEMKPDCSNGGNLMPNCIADRQKITALFADPTLCPPKIPSLFGAKREPELDQNRVEKCTAWATPSPS